MQGHAIPGGMSSESVGIGMTDSSRLVVPARACWGFNASWKCSPRRENDRVPATDSERAVGREESRLVAATSLPHGAFIIVSRVYYARRGWQYNRDEMYDRNSRC